MKKSIILLLCFFAHTIQAKPWATITINNKVEEHIIAILKHCGGLGTDTKERYICAQKAIPDSSSNSLKSYYPYTKNYHVVVYDPLYQIRYKSIRAVEDGQTLNFPDDFSCTSQWAPLKDELPYHKACFLTAHNAFTSYAHGWIYAQQSWGITKQLNHGVRALMLDLYKDPDNAENILLCHGGVNGIYRLQKFGKYQTFKDTLNKILSWLMQNKQEIVTVILENYAQDITDQVISNNEQLMPQVLTKHNWDPADHNGEWPTIGWLRKKKKRIIFFDGSGESNLRFKLNTYAVENPWGTLDLESATNENNRSVNNQNPLQQMYLLNYFGTVTPPSTCHATYNSYERLRTLVRYAKQKQLAQSRLPNFIALDFVDKGNPLRLVNRINDIMLRKHKAHVKKKKTKLKRKVAQKELLVPIQETTFQKTESQEKKVNFSTQPPLNNSPEENQKPETQKAKPDLKRKMVKTQLIKTLSRMVLDPQFIEKQQLSTPRAKPTNQP